jgi:DNA-binding HxlR family transcriptional regulator
MPRKGRMKLFERILKRLKEKGPMTFEELRKELAGVKKRILKATLTKMINKGLIEFKDGKYYPKA